MPTDPKLVRDHFLAAVELTAAERAAYLAAHCGDAKLRAAVERLLAAHDQPAALLNRPIPLGLEQTGAYVPREVPGTIIAGRYKLLEEIGEGGMGTVWVAEQTAPVRRKVALKLIKAGMDSKSVLARFDAERQALAVMDHPNIAKVLDGGLTETGRPFFVMEYVKGVPITEYCDATRLSVRERLNLFVQVCHAVQHAHQKGIIHRDLKPSNILVAPYDDKPVPKVIDFGLAKAMHQSLTERTLHTGHEAVLGTPRYMSPEQAHLNNLDVDTRSDIYSLGVLLYELLTGTTPLEKNRIKEAAWDEIRRIIREEEPPRPSTRLSSTNTLPTLAAGRQTEPARLTKLVRGELDWIVMKSLEKDRARRYETANSFAMDIQRHLAGEPVLAAPPSARYRLRKFARKYRAALTTAAAITLLLVGGVAAVVAVQVRANHDLAAKNAELADEQAKVQARFELAQKAIATFHTGVSEDALLKNEQFKELRTRLLKEAAGFYGDLEKLLERQTDAKSRRLLAEGYFQLGELTEKIGSLPEALAVHRKALAVRRELAAAEGADVEARLDVARGLQAVCNLMHMTGDRAGGLAASEEQRDIAAALAAESQIDAVRAMLARSHHNIGYALWSADKPGEALAAYERALPIRLKLAEANPLVTAFQSDLARSHNAIGSLLAGTGRSDEALVAYEKALAIRQKLAQANPAVASYQSDLALTYANISMLLHGAAKWAEALPEREKALVIQQKLADANPAVTSYQYDLAVSHTLIGALRDLTGKPNEALADYQLAMAIQQKLAEANPAVTAFQEGLAGSHLSIGSRLAETGKPEEALAAYRKALDIFQKLAAANPSDATGQGYLAMAHYTIGGELARTGKAGEALAAHQQALAIVQKAAKASPTAIFLQNILGWAHHTVGLALEQTGNPAEALAAFGNALDVYNKLADAHPTPFNQMFLAISHNAIGRLHARQGRFAEGFAALDKGLALRQKLADDYSANAQHTSFLGGSYADRGWAHVRAGHPVEAAADLRRAVALWDKLKAPVRPLGNDQRFDRSRALALLAGLGGDAKSGVTKAEAARCADQAVATLADAIKAGWGRIDELKEPDFDPLRGREDFKKLLVRLEKK